MRVLRRRACQVSTMGKGEEGYCRDRGGKGQLVELVVDVDGNVIWFQENCYSMRRRKPAIALLLELCDGDPKSAVTLYFRICARIREQEDRTVIDLKKHASNYVNVCVCHLRAALQELGAPDIIEHVEHGSESWYSLKLNPGLLLNFETSGPQKWEEASLELAAKLYRAGNFRGCLDILEGRCLRAGFFFRHRAALYCWIACMHGDDHEATLEYFESIHPCLLSEDDRRLYDKALIEFLPRPKAG